MPPIDTSKKSGKLALLVGIDEYDAVQDLQGCVNDVLDVQDLLVSHFGFAKDDTLVLKDGEATHSNIVEAFRKHWIECGKQTRRLSFTSAVTAPRCSTSRAVTRLIASTRRSSRRTAASGTSMISATMS